MREYELTFVVQPEISDEGMAQLRERIDAVLERHSAPRLLYDDLGRRKLAYEIRRFQKGHYWALSYLDMGEAVPEVERLLRLDDSVLRFLTVQVSEEVADIEARRAEAAELERVRAQKAAERAAREAEAAAKSEAEAAADQERAAEEENADDEDEGIGDEDKDVGAEDEDVGDEDKDLGDEDKDLEPDEEKVEKED